MNRSGQILIEHLLSLFFILTPLGVGAGLWAKEEYLRSRCALAAFQEARRQLILQDSRIDWKQSCGDRVQERVVLIPLKDLDRGSSGLGLSDWIQEVRSLWEQGSSFSSRSPESDSGGR